MPVNALWLGRAAVTIDTKALCQRTAAQHRGFVFPTNKRSAQLVTGHKDLLVFFVFFP